MAEVKTLQERVLSLGMGLDEKQQHLEFINGQLEEAKVNQALQVEQLAAATESNEKQVEELRIKLAAVEQEKALWKAKDAQLDELKNQLQSWDPQKEQTDISCKGLENKNQETSAFQAAFIQARNKMNKELAVRDEQLAIAKRLLAAAEEEHKSLKIGNIDNSLTKELMKARGFEAVKRSEISHPTFVTPQPRHTRERGVALKNSGRTIQLRHKPSPHQSINQAETMTKSRRIIHTTEEVITRTPSRIASHRLTDEIADSPKSIKIKRFADVNIDSHQSIPSSGESLTELDDLVVSTPRRFAIPAKRRATFSKQSKQNALTRNNQNSFDEENLLEMDGKDVNRQDESETDIISGPSESEELAETDDNSVLVSATQGKASNLPVTPLARPLRRPTRVQKRKISIVEATPLKPLPLAPSKDMTAFDIPKQQEILKDINVNASLHSNERSSPTKRLKRTARRSGGQIKGSAEINISTAAVAGEGSSSFKNRRLGSSGVAKAPPKARSGRRRHSRGMF